MYPYQIRRGPNGQDRMITGAGDYRCRSTSGVTDGVSQTGYSP
jgi:hypothetical protein|nr:hypothetical protein [Prevotella sp.]